MGLAAAEQAGEQLAEMAVDRLEGRQQPLAALAVQRGDGRAQAVDRLLQLGLARLGLADGGLQLGHLDVGPQVDRPQPVARRAQGCQA